MTKRRRPWARCDGLTDKATRETRLAFLVASDYGRLYAYKEETQLARRAMFLPRLVTNPSLQAVAMIRLCLAGPRSLHWLWRSLLIAKHAIDIHPAIEIGPGLELPHPLAIVIGGTAVLGRNVVLHHLVT